MGRVDRDRPVDRRCHRRVLHRDLRRGHPDVGVQLHGAVRDLPNCGQPEHNERRLHARSRHYARRAMGCRQQRELDPRLRTGEPDDKSSYGEYTPINIGGNPAGPCNPNGAVDSVAVTNGKAVVTTARPSSTFGGIRTTWVYIVDLTPSTGPVVVLEQEITPPDEFEGGEGNEENPHDVAITPTRDGGGDLAVVTTVHATAFFDLSTNTYLGADFDKDYRRRYQSPVDSVELTGKTAVTIADKLSGSTPIWAVKIYDLSTPDPLTVFDVLRDYVDLNPPTGGSRVHDLAIDWDFDKGLVRTSYSNVVLTSLTAPPPTSTVLASPNGSDAFAHERYNSYHSSSLFSSDSVALGIEQNGVLYGATIGGDDAGIQRYTGYVDLIDLSLATPAVNQVAIAPDPLDPTYGCVPSDIAIAQNQTDVVVRCSDRRPQAASFVGPDLTEIQLGSGVISRSWGGNGICGGTDALAVPATSGFVNSVRRMFSISQDATGGALGPEFNHIAH